MNGKLEREADIIDRYMKDNQVEDRKFAEELFDETKRFLAACAISNEPCAPSRLIDPMWHTFILFTAEYKKFCMGNFGKFINHCPEKDQNKNYTAYTNTLKMLNENLGGIDPKFWRTREGGIADYDQCYGPPEECHDGCCHNPCGSDNERIISVSPVSPEEIIRHFSR
jgi:hypothetical protein